MAGDEIGIIDTGNIEADINCSADFKTAGAEIACQPDVIVENNQQMGKVMMVGQEGLSAERMGNILFGPK